MREFQIIDEVMPDVPPASPERIAAVRARVLGVASDTGGGSFRPRRVRTVHGLMGTVLAAAAVVLVITVGLVVAPRQSEGPAVTPPRQVLDTAADRLAGRPPATGRYWRLETQNLMRMKGTEGYLVEERGDDVLVIGRDGDRYTWYEAVSARPYGVAAQRAWERSGSRELCPARGCDANARFYASRSLGQALRLADGLDLTLTELLDLPEEATALRTRLLASYPPGSEPSREQWLAQAGVKLVAQTPATPGTRAAAYRMLADLPGVRVNDHARDPSGRAGVVLRFPPIRGVVRIELVIDRQSGAPLAVQQVAPIPGLPEGTAWQATIIRTASWTDARPEVPPGCDSGCTG